MEKMSFGTSGLALARQPFSTFAQFTLGPVAYESANPKVSPIRTPTPVRIPPLPTYVALYLRPGHLEKLLRWGYASEARYTA